MQSVPYKFYSKTIQLKKVSNTFGHMGAIIHKRNNCKCNGDQDDIFSLEYESSRFLRANEVAQRLEDLIEQINGDYENHTEGLLEYFENTYSVGYH